MRASFERESYKANSDDTVLPLNFYLLDTDGIPLKDLAEPREIRLTSAGGSFTEFDPPTVTLSGTHARGTSNLRLPGFRLGRDLKVLAEGEALETGVAGVIVTATRIAVLLIALVGGLLGGVSRHVSTSSGHRMFCRGARRRASTQVSSAMRSSVRSLAWSSS